MRGEKDSSDKKIVEDLRNVYRIARIPKPLYIVIELDFWIVQIIKGVLREEQEILRY